MTAQWAATLGYEAPRMLARMRQAWTRPPDTRYRPGLKAL